MGQQIGGNTLKFIKEDWKCVILRVVPKYVNVMLSDLLLLVLSIFTLKLKLTAVKE